MDITSIAPTILTWLDKIAAYAPHIALLGTVGLGVFLAHRNITSKFNAYDYFIDSSTGKASVPKTLQIVAGLTGTWIVIDMAANKTLTVDFFITYLAALGVSEGWSKFIGAKFGKAPDSDNK